MIVRAKFAIAASALAVLALGALTACSSGGTSTGGGSTTAGGGSSGGTNVCSLISASAASSAMGVSYTGAKSGTLSTGEDTCTYATSASSTALIATVYESNSGMTWATASGVLSSLGSTTSVSGVGDKAILGGEQLDVQAGARIIAIEGDAVSTNSSGAEALAKKLISALG